MVIFHEKTMDTITKNRIDKLHPTVRVEVETIINEINTRLTGRSQVRISEGLRTIAEQDALYKKRPKVTNAKGGQSIHNYGLAVDIVLIVDGKTASWDSTKDWDGDKKSDWNECVEVFKAHGWVWGGDWKSFKDMPHFEAKGHKWQDLIKMPKDKEGYVILK
jgi:peptidoglycan LD-endopeptidase CwlK